MSLILRKSGVRGSNGVTKRWSLLRVDKYMLRNHVKAVNPESQAVNSVPVVLCVFTPISCLRDKDRRRGGHMSSSPDTQEHNDFFLLKTFLGVLPD